MAEIPIQKKSKSPIWPWILGILVVVAIVVWFITRNNANRQTNQNQSGSMLMVEYPLAIRAKSITSVPGIVYLKLETYMA
jgi:sensor domain CHASE-containing protein